MAVAPVVEVKAVGNIRLSEPGNRAIMAFSSIGQAPL
jgi:hypothetical protein